MVLVVVVVSVETALLSVVVDDDDDGEDDDDDEDDTAVASAPGDTAVVTMRTTRDSVETVVDVVVVVVVSWVMTTVSAEPPAPLPSAKSQLRLESSADGAGEGLIVEGVTTSDLRRSVSVLLCSLLPLVVVVVAASAGAESCKLLPSLGIFMGGMSSVSSPDTVSGEI